MHILSKKQTHHLQMKLTLVTFALPLGLCIHLYFTPNTEGKMYGPLDLYVCVVDRSSCVLFYVSLSLTIHMARINSDEMKKPCVVFQFSQTLNEALSVECVGHKNCMVPYLC